jgi:dTDP-4-dehydrorhamnose 3,5-epimerase
MQFQQTLLTGAYVIDPERHLDERGFFARTFCAQEFEKHGLEPAAAQCSVSFSRRRGTLRGLHYQAPPPAEVRLVRCTRGRVFDVIVDLREASETCLQWFATELSAENGRQLYVPEGFAHGFQTLEDECEVSYQMSTVYAPDRTGGIHYASPSVAIDWPLPVSVISDRDSALERR